MVIAAFSLLSSYSEADFLGKVIFIVLFILSVISWIFIVDKIKKMNRIKKNSFSFDRVFEKEKRNLLGFGHKNFSSDLNPYFEIYASVKQKTLDVLNKNRFFEKETYLLNSDMELIEAEVNAVVMRQHKFLEKGIFILSTIITLGPFLGLLGTVWGILTTFSNLSAGLSAGNSAVLSGLSMALGTTVFGLVIAIPALVGYNYLKSAFKDFLGDMQLFSHKLLLDLELQYKKVGDKE